VVTTIIQMASCYPNILPALMRYLSYLSQRECLAKELYCEQFFFIVKNKALREIHHRALDSA
jgi:hypothetical protein